MTKTSLEPIGSTPSSERRALEILAFAKALPSMPVTIAIAGESGSGKSTTAVSLLLELQKVGIDAHILHLDNYFASIPELKEERRRANLQSIGISELNIALLQEHIRAFKNGSNSIEIPILSQDRSQFVTTEVDFQDIDALIIEGTFVLALEEMDLKSFLDVSFDKSRSRSRVRDTKDEFYAKVLEILHAHIQPYTSEADIVFDEDGNLISNS